MVKGCLPCQSNRNKPPLISLHLWNWNWRCLHLDFLGPFLEATFLIAVNAYLKWLEVIPMSSTTAERTITELRKLFVTHGLPTQVTFLNLFLKNLKFFSKQMVFNITDQLLTTLQQMEKLSVMFKLSNKQ